MLLQRKAYQDLTEFSVNFQAHFIYKDPIFLSAQTETLRSVTHFHWMGFQRSSIITESWLLISWGFNISEDTFSNWGSIYGVFWRNSDQEWDVCTRSEYEELSRKLDLWPILECHQPVAKPRAMHFLPLLQFPLRGVKITTLCLPILFCFSKRETGISWKEFRQSVRQ